MADLHVGIFIPCPDQGRLNPCRTSASGWPLARRREIDLFHKSAYFGEHALGNGQSGLGEFFCAANRSPEPALLRSADNGWTIGFKGRHSRREAGTAGLSVGHAHRLAAALRIAA